MAKTLVSQSNIRTITLRETSELTTDYVFTNGLNIQGANQLQLLVSFTKGDSGGCRLKIEFSEDELDWYQESSYTLSEDIYAIHKPAYREVQDSSNILISVPISATFFRIGAAAITSFTGTYLSIVATIANI